MQISFNDALSCFFLTETESCGFVPGPLFNEFFMKKIKFS